MEMDAQQLVQKAQEFLAVSDAEFAKGDDMQASEKLWGAAAHAVMAVAQQRGWPYGKHYALKVAVQRLAHECAPDGDPLSDALVSEFTTAESFHANFYHDFMEDFQIETGRPIVRRFVNRVLGMVE